jgi:hypothetical protein
VGAQSTFDLPVIARVTLKSRKELERFVTLGLDLLEAREGDDRFILTTQAQVEWLRKQGWTVTVDNKRTATLSITSQEGINTYMGGYRTVAEISAFLNEKVALYPNLAEVFVYGSSWEKVTSGGAAGHDLFGIKLTNKQRPGPKPRFFLMAAIHARELTTSEVALRFVDYLLNGYGVNGDATWLLDEHEIIIVPVVNPDGRIIAEQGYYQRKNTNNTYGGNCPNPPTPFEQIGVDLNRNSSYKWGTVNSPNEPKCGQTYPGPSPASEPETAALENLVRSLFPDQRGPLDTDAAPMTTTGVLISLHSYGNLVLWPWGHTGTPAPNQTGLSLIGRKFAAYNDYEPDQSTGLYPASGTTDDWAYGELGIPSYTFEMGPNDGECSGFFPPLSCLDGGTDGAFWPRNLQALLYAARIARAPYQLAQGPAPETLDASSLISNPGQIDLVAQFDKQWSGGTIVAAEYYVDNPPWRGGTPFQMTPLDGSFNSAHEVATATVGPLFGRHQFYVRARDASGNWGPVRGAIFTTAAPSTIQIEASNYNVNESAGHATVVITRSGDSSAPASVTYSSSDTAGLNNCNVINGKASSRCDYTTAVGTISFAAGDTAAKTISIPLVDDAFAEGQESFTLSLSNPSGASLGSVGTTSIIINDNETSNAANPIDQTAFFVRQHYIDFLNREPEPQGFTDWQSILNNCPAGNTTCDRIEVSSSFFRSPEFRERGYFPYRFYSVALGRKPNFAEFMPDLARVSGFLTEAEKEQARQDFIAEFMTRAEFTTIYNGLTDNAYVQRLYDTAGVSQVTVPNVGVLSVSGMQQRMSQQSRTRAQVLREIAESPEVDSKYFTQAFVVMQYFGYLRRDPDASYLQLIDQLNANPANYRPLVHIFVDSQEYRARFGAP